MEKKMQSLEQSNFGLKEKIFSANAESDYDGLKKQVLSLVAEHNKWLQKQLLNPSNY
jgi:lysine/ornithine N-monooxygenase